MVTQLVTEQTPGLEIELTVESEDEGPEGSFATGNDADDDAMVADINRRIDTGDVWAWCYVRVTATYRGVSVADGIGGCSYTGEKDFRANGCYADMVHEVLSRLNAQLEAIDACELAPHNKAILACTCGYKRTQGHGR